MFGDVFSRFARRTERQTGRPGAFVLSLAVVVVWGVTGPIWRNAPKRT